MKLNNMLKRISAVMLTMLLLIITVSAEEVILGGEPFGIRIFTDGAVVVKLECLESDEKEICPAKDAGVMLGDIIRKINGKTIMNSETITTEIQNAASDITLGIIRDGDYIEINVKPAKDADGIKRAGMVLRDSTAGIGTVTFAVPSTGEFCGLGHGIYDADTGKLLPMSKGTVSDVSITGAVKGIPGTPGELKGYFTVNNVGTILQNTDKGIYGILNTLPADKKIEIAEKSEVMTGDAIIVCTLSGTKPSEYKAEIKVDRNMTDDNFIITVTDNALIEKTGGIVQGMSGSPIIQNGKLVGAVTHVLVDNPVSGYGIFAEAMTEEFGI